MLTQSMPKPVGRPIVVWADSLSLTALAAALALSGDRLHVDMSEAEVVAAVNAAVAEFGVAELEARGEAALQLNLDGMYGLISNRSFGAGYRRLFGSWKRHCLANSEAQGYRFREDHARMRLRLHGSASRDVVLQPCTRCRETGEIRVNGRVRGCDPCNGSGRVRADVSAVAVAA